MIIVWSVVEKFRMVAAGSLLASVLSLLSACAVTSESTTEYFLLNGTSKPGDAVMLDPFSLGVGPVELAAYLDDEGIANHLDTNKIVYSDGRRWAEPLDNNVSQVLVSNLTILLPNQTVYEFPWKVTQAPDYQLKININRFGWFPQNKVAIEARVELENASGEIMFTSEESFDLVAGGADYQSNVAAQNQLLDQFSSKLVTILKEIIPRK